MKSGLCSVTFRRLAVEELVLLVRQAGLDAIEWGGDIHVPAGDTNAAETARCITEDAGLETAAYGSYYRVVDSDGKPEPFEPVLETAVALGTQTIRIWAGRLGPVLADSAYWKTVVEETRRLATMAQDADIRLGLEFHAGTLTDSSASMNAFLHAVDHPNLYSYWQPDPALANADAQLEGLKNLGDRMLNLHVFQWASGSGQRRPLVEGAAEWRRYLAVSLNPAVEHYALMEFVRDDDPVRFLEDAAILRSWFEEADRSGR